MQQVPEALPRRALPLTSAVEPCEQKPIRLIKERCQLLIIAPHPVVIVISTELGVACLAQVLQSPVSVLFDPGRAVRDGTPELLACGTPLELRCASSVSAPAQGKAQKITASCLVLPASTAAENARLFRRTLSTTSPKPFAEHPVKALRIPLALERAHTVIRVPPEIRRFLTVRFHHFFKPSIQRIVQIDIS